ncbi:hypothetical protein CL657_00730 [bacterium]|nr:hypothetical protein [bacterium]
MKYGEFHEPKPPRFHLFIDLRPSKSAEIKKEMSNFNDILDKKSNKETQSKQNNTSSQSNTNQSQTQLAHSLLQTSMIQQGAKHLSHHMLANAEFVGNKQNFEGINNPAYINYAAAFQAGFNATSIDDIKKKKKHLQEAPSDSSEDSDSTEDNHSMKNLTYTHNLNLFKQLDDINPFKKMDRKNHKIFEQSPMYTMLNSTFMSPQSLLGEDLFLKNKEIIGNINKAAPKLEDSPDVYTNNNIETIDIHSNYNSIEKPADESLAQWDSWDTETSAHYLLKRHSDLQLYTKVIRQFSGKIQDQQPHIDRINDHKKSLNKVSKKLDQLTEKMNSILKTTLDEINQNPDVMSDPELLKKLKSQLNDSNEIANLIENNEILLSEENLETFIFYKTQLDQMLDLKKTQSEELANYVENQALTKTKHWWNTVGKTLDQTGLLLPFALMTESAEEVFNSSALDIGASSDSIAGKLNQKLIIDTAKHLNKNDFQELTKPSSTYISIDNLKIDNPQYGQYIFDRLVKQNIIDTTGKIVNFDSSNMFQDFGLESENENNRVRKILKTALLSQASFDSFDITLINNHQIEDIKLIDPENNSWDLPTLLASIPTNSDAKETFVQARKVYNVLFDILETMCGDNLTKHGKLKPNIRHQDSGVSVPIYKNAEWLEYNEAIPFLNQETNIEEKTAGWEKVEGSPLEITFSSLEKVNEFFDLITTSVLKLEPLVSSFDPRQDSTINDKEKHYHKGNTQETDIRLLIDNEGELGDKGIITKSSDAYRYDIDTIARPTFFQTSHYKQISSYLKSSILVEIGTSIFSKSQINSLNKKRHKKKTEEFKERKTQWEEEEYQRKKEEKKLEAKRKTETKRTLKKAENRAKKRKEETDKAIQTQALKKEAEKKQRLKANKKASKKASKKTKR